MTNGNDGETLGAAETMDPVTGERSGRRSWVLPVTVLAVAALSVWGLQRMRFSMSHESTNDAFVGGPLVPVLVKVGGFADEVRVEENQHVAAGDVLLVLDDAELRQRVAQAEAEVGAARTAVGSKGVQGQAEARVAVAESQRASLSAQIEAARARAMRAERDRERLRGLADKEIISRQQLDAAEAEADAARAQVLSLERQRAAAAAEVGLARAGVQEAEARLAAALASLESAQLQLSYARIAAPISGIVSKRSVEPGQLLQPGQPVLTVVSDAVVHVTANFKETQLAGMRAGQIVEFEVDAYEGCAARGEVQGIGGATGSQFSLIPPDNATGNFTKVVQRVPVRIRVVEGCGAERPLRPGMSVNVHVRTG